MANEYYATTGSPATSSQGASATMRSEFTSVAAGFDKMPALAGNGSKLVQINSGGTAMAAIALTVGALLFGGAAGVLGQDGTNLFWDNTAKRLGIGNAAPSVALDVTGAGKFSTGLTVGTTLTASTSVVTPLLTTSGAVDLGLGVNGVFQWTIKGATGDILPNGDNNTNFGSAAKRVLAAFTGIIDSGTTGSLSLRTNNGLTQALIINAAVAPDRPISINAGQAGVLNATLSVGNGVGFAYSTGDNSHQFYTDASTLMQFEITRTVGANRHAFITGSNGGNPTLGVTGGSLAITPAVVLGSSLNFSTAAGKIIPGATSISLRNNADSADNLLISDAGVITTRATTLTLGASPTIAVVSGSLAIAPSVVIAGASLQVGTNPASTANSLAIPYGGIIASRNNANTQDLNLISSLAINGINDVISVGNGAQGVTINGRVQAGAPSASDITSGKFMVWRDTSGATTKLYYNNGGVLQSVALA